MGRKPDTKSLRGYRLSPEAMAQRKQAAIDRWAALEGASKEERSLDGRPRKLKPTKRKRGARITTAS